MTATQDALEGNASIACLDEAPERNRSRVVCAACKTVIFLEGAAQRKHRRFWMHRIEDGAAPLEAVDEHWHVRDQLAFENIAVSRPLPTKEGCELLHDVARYLMCAECERGPIGLMTHTRDFFVALQRVHSDRKLQS